MTPEQSIIPAGWTAQIIGKNGCRYMILLRPGDHLDVDESRLEDVAIIVDPEARLREPPWFLQLYLKFDAGWENCPHDPAMMAKFLGFPESPRRPGYEEEFKRMQESLGRRGQSKESNVKAITFEHAYFVKLGQGGKWEADSIATDKVRIGWTEIPLDDIHQGRWNAIKQIITGDKPSGAKTHDYDSLKTIAESTPGDIWITFHKSKLWWCRVEGQIEEDDTSKFKSVKGRWSDKDIKGNLLLMDNISGRLLRVVGYRATICRVKQPSDLRLLINAEVSPEYADMDAALDQLAVKVEVALQRLHPKDFELLVDLLFQRAGWQRISVVGENVKFTDMNLQEPITKDRYQVQVKSEATKEEFESYRSEFEDSPFRRLYFVVHSPHRSLEAVSTDPDDKVQLIFSKRLARMAIDAGLVGWLMQKVR